MLFSAAETAFAISEGQRVNFNSSNGSYEYNGMSFGTAKFTVSGQNGYVGTCGQYGMDNFPGPATVTRVSNNSRQAKAVYYFGLVLGWQDNVGESSYKGGALQAICHDVTGSLDRYLELDSNMGSQSRAEKALANEAYAAHPNWESVEVPSGFELYYCYAEEENTQNVLYWRMNIPVGKLKLKKVSQNKSITG